MNTKNYSLSVLLMMLAVSSVNAKIWRVNNNTNYNHYVAGADVVFSSLSDAITAAAVGDTLYVEASQISYGDILLDKMLHLIGTGYFLTENPGLQHNILSSKIGRLTFTSAASGSSVSGLDINVGQDPAVKFNNNVTDITIARCRIRADIELVREYTYNNILITKNYVEGGLANSTVGGSGGDGNHYNLIIANNYFSQACGINTANTFATVAQNVFAATFVFNSQVQFYNNICLGTAALAQNGSSEANIHDNIFKLAPIAWLNGGTNIFSATEGQLFNDFALASDSRFQLKNPTNCPQCYLGYPGDTMQIGMFGGGDAYILSGIPAIPTIYDLIAPNTAPQNGTFEVTISARTNN